MLPQSVRIFVCTQPVDMRKSFDGLALAAKQQLDQEPQSGHLFVFVNRRNNRLKILWFDQNGYCILYKRLHRALFRVPKSGNEPCLKIDGQQLSQILKGVPKPPRKRTLNRK